MCCTMCALFAVIRGSLANRPPLVVCGMASPEIGYPKTTSPSFTLRTTCRDLAKLRENQNSLLRKDYEKQFLLGPLCKSDLAFCNDFNAEPQSAQRSRRTAGEKWKSEKADARYGAVEPSPLPIFPFAPLPLFPVCPFSPWSVAQASSLPLQASRLSRSQYFYYKTCPAEAPHPTLPDSTFGLIGTFRSPKGRGKTTADAGRRSYSRTTVASLH